MQTVGLVTITIEASLLILIVLLVRRCFGEHLHPWVMKCLWGIVALRILIPVEVPVDVSWLKEIRFPFPKLGMGVWLTGVILFLLLFVARNLQFGRKLKTSSEVYGKKDGVLVYFVDDRIGSCLKGLLAPKIYISRLAESSFDWCKWIVRHELSHYYAWDNWYVFLRNLCLVVQWFNPLVWYAASCCAEDCELACDYRVLKGENREEQIVYGKCLVAMASKKPLGMFNSITMGNSLSSGSLRRRIEQLGKERFCPSILELLLVACMFGITLCSFVGPRSAENEMMTRISRLSFLQNRIVCYTLEEPAKENQETLIENMKRRRSLLDEDVLIAPLNDTGVAVIFTGNTYDVEERANRLAVGAPVIVELSGEQYSFEVTEEQLKDVSGEDGYGVWLELAGTELEGKTPGEYRVYFGGRLQYEGAEMDMADGYLCLFREIQFDYMYDKKQLLVLKNPCGLETRR